MKTLVLIPVLNRPERAAAVVASLRASEPRAEPLFLASPGDDEEIMAAVRVGWTIVVDWEAGPGDYARKMNYGYALAREVGCDWVFLGADDLYFHGGWLDACLAENDRYSACVIGTNDLGNSRTKAGYHSTHTLVHADYLACGGVADDPTRILCERYDHQFCNPPDAPIWMADLTFKPIGAVRIGDRVIGWEYNAEARPTVGRPRRSLCFSEVLAIGRRKSPLVRVVMESGRSFRCTPDHRWLNAAWMPASNHDRQWVEPREGRILLHVIDEPAPRFTGFEREYGWLAGIYDGEGSGIVVASQSSGNAEVVEQIERLLQTLEIPHTHSVEGDMHHFVLNGGRQAYLDYLLQVDPIRRRSLASHVVGYRRRDQARRERSEIGGRRFGHRDRIVAVESLPGVHEVVSMTTTSGNYIAHGYASRNCDDEFVQTAISRGTYRHAPTAWVEHLHPNWGKAADGDTYRKGAARFEADRRLYEARKGMWLPGPGTLQGSRRRG